MKSMVQNQMNKILKRNIEFEFGPKREGDAEYSVADISKFLNKFKWKPKYNNINYILKSALDWEYKNI